MKPAPIFLALVLAACSSLDPSTGPHRVEQPTTSDAGPDADGPGFCSEVDPGEVCFARDIRPILRRTRDEAMAMGTGRGCYPCHDGNAPSHNGTSLSGLDMSTLGELRKGGGSSGQRIIVPGKPNESVMVQALRGQYMFAPRMPKNGPFHVDSSEEMRLITTWILEGARGLPDE